MKHDLLKGLSSCARRHYHAALLEGFGCSIFIIAYVSFCDNASPGILALVAVCGLMGVLCAATQCIRITLVDQKENEQERTTTESNATSS